ncbi:MAG: hypothetical protein M1835_007714 [Candelina submexicana]|nr:MAG: hypothetical protein M1835_007714 [Candelina submexicana]
MRDLTSWNVAHPDADQYPAHDCDARDEMDDMERQGEFRGRDQDIQIVGFLTLVIFIYWVYRDKQYLKLSCLHTWPMAGKDGRGTISTCAGDAKEGHDGKRLIPIPVLLWANS